MKIKGEFVLRELVGETILVPVGRTALQLNGMITLNPVSAQIWRGLDQGGRPTKRFCRASWTGLTWRPTRLVRIWTNF